MNNIHKNSGRAPTEKYQSTPFDSSSQNKSQEVSNREPPQTLQVPKTSTQAVNRNHLLKSQKFLEVPRSQEYLLIKEKRVKSQAQTQNFEDQSNFTSINRIHKFGNEILVEKKEEVRKSGRLRESSEEVGHSNSHGYLGGNSPGLVDFQDPGYDRGSPKMPMNADDFFNEPVGNVYSKRVEDFCGNCVEILQKIKSDCESCFNLTRRANRRSDGARSSEQSKPGGTQTCLNCWNLLSQYNENCSECNNEAQNRSRNITFANQIVIKKKSGGNVIGVTMVDFDQNLDSESERVDEDAKFHRKHEGQTKYVIESKMFSNQDAPEELWPEPQGDNRRDLSIHIPGQDFSMEDSARKVSAKVPKKYK